MAQRLNINVDHFVDRTFRIWLQFGPSPRAPKPEQLENGKRRSSAPKQAYNLSPIAAAERFRNEIKQPEQQLASHNQIDIINLHGVGGNSLGVYNKY